MAMMHLQHLQVRRKTLMIGLLWLVITLASMLLGAATVRAQDQGYLYGEVVTTDGQKFKGALRWDDEEAFWDDIFNSQKTRNEHTQVIGDAKKAMRTTLDKDDDDDDNSWVIRFDDLWKSSNRNNYSTHVFTCRFGDLARIIVMGDDEATLEFKNGHKINVEGGSNDLGHAILVYDAEIGEVKMRWSKIDMITFLETPQTLPKKFGEPLYGRVRTTRGELEGFIQWDHQECLSRDKLDGYADGNKLSIEFENITKIEQRRRGSMVTLKSGREFYLTGSNDVDDDNKGVIIKNEQWGKAKVSWREFIDVQFDSKAPGSGQGYSAYAKPKQISGTVRTFDGTTLRGRIIYDLDESWDFEILDGEDNSIEYKIPFRLIKSIRPMNRSYSRVKLRSGQELLLGEGQDVTDSNDGLLVFSNGDQEPVMVRWDNIDEIIFD